MQGTTAQFRHSSWKLKRHHSACMSQSRHRTGTACHASPVKLRGLQELSLSKYKVETAESIFPVAVAASRSKQAAVMLRIVFNVSLGL